MVAVPMLYVFMTHYMFQLLRLIKEENDKAERLNDLGKRLFLFGLVSLFSINFLQSSVITAVLAWITLICVIIIHCFIFLRETGHKYHNNGLFVYYTLLCVWQFCNFIVYIYNATSWDKFILLDNMKLYISSWFISIKFLFKSSKKKTHD